ncbi:hypothetical protein IHE45_17G102000 [Dioscorea alata]|uniref:Uncharacterized protein n=1 Tax=Dioscorea alata TaxID=55571 RepID=A0ACB7UEE0_DIOAL|nr:hypothetical protein IHE45_17G102000 [Dioscorea alata]
MHLFLLFLLFSLIDNGVSVSSLPQASVKCSCSPCGSPCSNPSPPPPSLLPPPPPSSPSSSYCPPPPLPFYVSPPPPPPPFYFLNPPGNLYPIDPQYSSSSRRSYNTISLPESLILKGFSLCSFSFFLQLLYQI